jgi:hypothetical protein
MELPALLVRGDGRGSESGALKHSIAVLRFRFPYDALPASPALSVPLGYRHEQKTKKE